jgi:hypothetical protein
MYNKRIVALDSQKLDSMMSCTYQYKQKFGVSSDSPGLALMQVPDYFERGGLMHTMLDPYYNMKKHRSRWIQNRRTHMDVVNSCITIGRHAARKLALDIAEIEMCIDAFLQYTDYWENDNWYNILAVENVGSKILYDSPEVLILYEYKVDLIVEINGNITPIDHKSAKSHRDPNFLSNQFRGYCWALNTNNIIVNEIGFQKTKPPKEKFKRQLLCYSPNLIEEWRQDAIYWILYTLDLIDKNVFPRNVTSCDKFPPCPFKETVCSQDPEVRDFKIMQNFKPKVWDVGASL